MLVVGLFFIDRLITYVLLQRQAFGNMNLFSVILVMMVMAYESQQKLKGKAKFY